MSIDEQIIQLLHAGHSDRAIALQLHVRRSRARALRTELGIPTCKPGSRPATAEEIFWRRAVPTPDGHLRWPGYTTDRGHNIRIAGRSYTVHRIAWQIRHQRPPVGHIKSGCGITGCVLPDHVDDQQIRDQYAAIFGEAA